MTTKKEIMEIIKAENADGLRIGNDVDGYEVLNKKDTDAILDEWANGRLEKISRQAEIDAKANSKAAILDRIGLTADELKTIIG